MICCNTLGKKHITYTISLFYSWILICPTGSSGMNWSPMYQKRRTRKLVLMCLQNGGNKLQHALLTTTLIKVSIKHCKL